MNRVVEQIPEEIEIESYRSHDDEILPSYLISGRQRDIAVTLGIFSQDPKNSPLELDDLDEEDDLYDSLEDELEYFDLDLFDDEDNEFIHEDDFKFPVPYEFRGADYIWAKAVRNSCKGRQEEYWYFGKIDPRMRENIVLSLVFDTPNCYKPLSIEERMVKFAYDTNPIDILDILSSHVRKISRRIKKKDI